MSVDSEPAAERARSRWIPGSLRPDVAGRRGLRGMVVVLRHHLGGFAAAAVAGLLTQALGILALVLGGVVLATALQGAGIGEVAAWAASAIAVVLLRSGALWIEAWISHELAYRILAEVRLWLYDAFARAAPARLGRRRTGEVVSSAMDDSQAMEMFYAHSLLYAVVAAVMTPVTIAGIAIVDPVAGLIVGVGALAAGLVPLLLRRTNQRHGEGLRALLATTNADGLDVVAGLAEVTSLRGGEDLVAQLHRGARRTATLQRRQSLRVAAEQGVAHACTSLTAAAVAGWLLLGPNPPSTATTLILVLCVFGAFEPIHTLLGATKVWGVTTAAADRIFDLLEEPAAVRDDGRIPPERCVSSRGLELRGVDFSYPGSAPVLREVSFEVGPGETVALVGHSGAGKSTAASLVLRLHDPDAGVVRIGGVDTRDLSLKGLRRLVATVPQDVLLLHESLADNIRLGNRTLEGSHLDEVVAATGLRPIVDRLPDGLETVVGDRGVLLSGGERQRVALARALARRPRVLLVDEGTSMLDALSESEMRDAMAHRSHARATLVIAHRLSTIAAADRVVMLERGRVIATGTHAELLAREPAYHRLVIDQLAGLSALSTNP